MLAGQGCGKRLDEIRPLYAESHRYCGWQLQPFRRGHSSRPDFLRLRTTGIMESKGIHRVYEPSPVPTLYVGRVEDLLGRVPLIPCFLDRNATSTIPRKYSSRQKHAFECGCADSAGPTSRRGSHIYEINTRLWNFGRPQPRAGGLWPN